MRHSAREAEGDAAAASDDHSAKEKQINFSNWTEYMDVSEDEKHRPTLEAFTKRTGIKVKYTEDINDNVEFFGKIKPQLAAARTPAGTSSSSPTGWPRGSSGSAGPRSSTR